MFEGAMQPWTILNVQPENQTTPMRTLIIGFGNPDRQDDGVAWHILESLSDRYGGLSIATCAADILIADFSPGSCPALLYQLQLTPELVELFTGFDQIIFIDAQTGETAQGVQVVAIDPVYKSSPLTHHLTPDACMALLRTVYRHSADGILLTIQGSEFGFGSGLSPMTAEYADQAVEILSDILQKNWSTDEGAI